MSAMSITGAIAASAAANAASTSSAERAPIQLGHDGVELLAVLDPSGEGGEAGSSPTPSRRMTRPATESDEVETATQTAVGAAVGAPRDGVRDARAEAGLLLAGQLVDGDEGAHQLEQRLQQVHVDDLTDAGVQGDHRREGADQAGDLVRERDGREERWTVGFAGDRRVARHGFGDRSETGPARVGTGLAEAGEAGDDEVRVAVVQDLRPEAEALERPRAEVLDEGVRAVDQVQEDGAILMVLQVEGDEALVAVGELPPQTAAVPRVAPGHAAQAVALGPLHLDDIRAEVGQVAGHARSRDQRGQVEHPEVGQGQVRHGGAAYGGEPAGGR